MKEEEQATKEPVMKEETPAEEQKFEIKDEDVLSHIKDRYGKEINSLDELSLKENHPLNYQRMLRLSSNTRRRLVVV